MDLISFYFAKDTNRIRLLLAFSYLTCVVLITKQILSIFGYEYRHPKEITIATGINFILSGEILIPILFFTLYIFITHLGSTLLYAKFFPFFRKTVFRNHSTTQESLNIRKEMTSKGWVVLDKQLMLKGGNYRGFKEHMDMMFYDEFTLGVMFRIMAAVAFNALIILLFFTEKTTLVWVLIVTSFIWFLFAYLCVFSYMIKAGYKPFYEMYINHLEHPELFPYPPPYYSPPFLLQPLSNPQTD